MSVWIATAALAGLASALLAGAAAVGSPIASLLLLIAPLPLMIVAIGWHPLLALIGGAITAALLAVAVKGSAGVMFFVLVAIPSYLAAQLIWSRRFEGPVLIGALAAGAALYGALATLVGALSISFDFATFDAAVLRQSEAVYRFMMALSPDAALEPVRGQDPRIFIRAYADAVAPVCAVVLGALYMVNIWLAVRIAQRSGRLLIDWTPVYTMDLPRLILPITALSMLGGLLPGYPGMTFELISVAAILTITTLGYAAVHAITQGLAARGLILGMLWLLTMLFGLPALLMLVAGILELAFGWRRTLRDRRLP